MYDVDLTARQLQPAQHRSRYFCWLEVPISPGHLGKSIGRLESIKRLVTDDPGVLGSAGHRSGQFAEEGETVSQLNKGNQAGYLST